MNRIGLIGLGLLGSALAERFQAAGYSVLGHDIAPRRCAELSEVGVEIAATVQAIPPSVDAIVLCLPNSDVVRDVLQAILPCIAPGQLIIDTSTGDPDQTVQLAELAKRHAAPYVDATIGGSSQLVREGRALVMAGGEQDALQRAEAILQTFSSRVFHVGPSGSGARMKLVLNLVLGLNRAVLAEGLNLARGLGLDWQLTLDILRAGPAHSAVMDIKGEKMITGDFRPQAKLAQHLKDVKLILQAGERTERALPLSQVHQALLEHAVGLGLGDADNSAILRAFDDFQ